MAFSKGQRVTNTKNGKEYEVLNPKTYIAMDTSVRVLCALVKNGKTTNYVHGQKVTDLKEK